LIQQSIVAHNGNLQPSWSSGVNLYTAGGSYQDNIIRRNVSFENIDISSHHSDGSGFILDQSSTGALFENNIGFRNGGSCIRVNCPGSHVVNNTCYHDGLEPSDAQGLPAAPGEIYYSDATAKSGAVFQNNLAAASGYNNTQTAFGGPLPTQTTNYAVNANAATPFFVNPAGANPDFHLTSSATANIVDKGTASGAPTQDIGFDAKCIKSGSPGGASWWSYTIDYAYIASIGGVARCFNPATRSNTPDIGAYEYNGTTPATGGASGTGGTTSTGGSNATGGTTARGGTTSAGGSTATGGATARGGTTSAGSTALGGTTSGGSKATGGTIAGSGGTQAAGGVTGTGGTVMTGTGGLPNTGGSKATGGTTSTVPGTGGATVVGGSNAGGSLGSGGLVASGGVNAIGGVVAAVGGTNASMGGSAGGAAGGGPTGGAANSGGNMGGAGGAGTSGASNSGEIGGCGCRVAGGPSGSTLAGLLSLLALGFARRSSASAALRRAIRGGDGATLSKADNAGR